MMNANDSRTKRLLAAATLIILAACSSSSSGGGGAATVTQTGRIVTYTPCALDADLEPVRGATVTIGSQTATTATDGTYTIQVPSGESFTMRVTKTTTPAYVPLIEADDTVSASYNRGDTKFISASTAQLLESTLTTPPLDTAKAMMTLQLVPTGSCTDLGGSTIVVSPADSAAVIDYPTTCVSPSGGNASVTNGIFPSAVIYNLTPGTQTVAVTSPKCTQIPFPYTDPTTGLTYDGNVTTEANGGISFLKIFMK